MERKTIFLDIDGVFHTQTGTDTMFRWMPFFVEIVLDVEVDIVIHSTWRQMHKLQTIKKEFPVDVRHKIIDITPVDLSRYESILAYVQDHSITDYIILDDFDFEFPGDCRGLVLCDEQKGISDPVVQQQIRLFLEA